MKHVRNMVVAFAALLALSAVVTATASAAKPEFLPLKAGEKYKGESKVTSKLATEKKGTIECTKNKESGETTGTTGKTGVLTVDFEGCTVFGIANAHSLGDASNIILVHGTTTLCYINAANKEVGIVIHPEPVHIEVAGKLVEVKGSVIGHLTPINSSKTGPYKAAFTQSGGKQTVTKCEGGATETLLTAENEGTFENSAEEATDEFSFEKAVELMA